MYKILRFLVLVALIKLSCQKCSEKNPDICFGGNVVEDTSTIARSSELLWNSLHHDTGLRVKIPENFDARDHWPQCRNVIGRIKNQGRCGVCWSFAASMSLADRVCIAGNGTTNDTRLDFSVQDLCTCCKECLPDTGTDPPCETGGFQHSAVKHFVTHGLVLTECKSYNIDILQRRVRCHQKCDDKRKKYSHTLHKSQVAHVLHKEKNQRLIQVELMKYGPIGLSVDYCTDAFMEWDQKGVFSDTTPKGEKDSGHAMRLIGWGTENNIPYWLIANSWSKDWGDQGTVKIERTPKKNILGVNDWFFIVRTSAMPLLSREKPTGSKAFTSLPSHEFLITVFVCWYVQ